MRRSVSSATMTDAVIDQRGASRRAVRVSLPMFEDYVILDDHPVMKGDVTDTFNKNVEWLDFGIANAIPYTAWSRPKIATNREYKMQRPAGMDYWREFFNHCRGQQRSFLLPTFRNDIPLSEPPELGSYDLLTQYVEYSDLFQDENLRRIRIETANGVLYRRIVECVTYDATTLRLRINEPIGNNENDNVVGKISFILLMRLNDDKVTLEHYAWRETYVALKAVSVYGE